MDNTKSPLDILMSFSEADVARQLTYNEMNLFYQLRVKNHHETKISRKNFKINRGFEEKPNIGPNTSK